VLGSTAEEGSPYGGAITLSNTLAMTCVGPPNHRARSQSVTRAVQVTKDWSAPGSSRMRIFAVRANQTYACQTFCAGPKAQRKRLGRMTRRQLRPSETRQRTFSSSRFRSIVGDVGVHWASSLMPRFDNSRNAASSASLA
jgi:hypothetical protein